MDTFKAILNRRSVREYTQKEVSPEDIKKILEAGMAAPSAGNQQPWEFMIITEVHLLKQIAYIHPYAKMTHDVTVAILVCGNTKVEKHKDHWQQDCAASTENMLLAITALELGGVWCGIYPHEDRVEKFQDLFLLPKHIIPFAVIPIGHTTEKSFKIDRFNKAKIHYNEW
jgi:nitroreductase